MNPSKSISYSDPFVTTTVILFPFFEISNVGFVDDTWYVLVIQSVREPVAEESALYSTDVSVNPTFFHNTFTDQSFNVALRTYSAVSSAFID